MTDQPALERLQRFMKSTALARRLAAEKHRRSLRRWTASDTTLAGFYSTFVSTGDLCFDIGANYGNRTKVFLRLGARVVAVEPQPSCCQVLPPSMAPTPTSQSSRPPRARPKASVTS